MQIKEPSDLAPANARMNATAMTKDRRTRPVLKSLTDMSFPCNDLNRSSRAAKITEAREKGSMGEWRLLKLLRMTIDRLSAGGPEHEVLSTTGRVVQRVGRARHLWGHVLPLPRVFPGAAAGRPGEQARILPDQQFPARRPGSCGCWNRRPLLHPAANVEVNRPAVELGLLVFEAGGDFADGIIAYEGNWLGGETFVSLDEKAVALLSAQGQSARIL